MYRPTDSYEIFIKGNKATRLQQGFALRSDFSGTLAQIGQSDFESEKVG